MIIEVRKAKSWPTYLVRIENDVYEMNEDANQPNGVCIYSGDLDEICIRTNFFIGDIVTEIPIGLVSQIAYLANKIGKESVVDDGSFV